MKKLIELIDDLIENDKIISKKIHIDDNSFNVVMRLQDGLQIQFSFTKKKDSSYHNELLDRILKLLKHNVKHLPF